MGADSLTTTQINITQLLDEKKEKATLKTISQSMLTADQYSISQLKEVQDSTHDSQ